MRTRVFSPIATIFSLLLLVTVPVQASPIRFADVVNVMGDLQRGGQTGQLRLRVAQDPGAPRTVTTTSKSPLASVAPSTDGNIPAVESTAGAPIDGVAPSLIAGTDVVPQQQGDVQVFEQDNIDGTICDCGEIPAAGGGFPKWPFLALIPLICVTGICTHDDKVCKDCVTPTPTPPIPEPASLLLFGSGIVALSASARRRYAKMRAVKQASTMTEV